VEPGSESVRHVGGEDTLPYAFVGDLHGRVNLLRTILERDPEKRYHYVFLGDTIHHKAHFKYNKRCSPIKVLRILDALMAEGRCTLVLGNNENYVLNALVLPGQSIKKKELKYTLECLRELPLAERLRYIAMLSNAPTHLELEGRYRLAHAYYPHDGQDVPRDTVLFGPGYAWFRDPDLQVRHHIDPSYTYYFGHYGLPYWHQNVHIIDATSLEATGVYYTDRDEFMIYY
jgi:hypothetical protein